MIPAKLSMQQVASQIGTNLGTLIQMRARGAKLFDATFPPMTNGTFDSTEIAAWLAAKRGQSQVQPDPQSSPSNTTNTSHRNTP